MGAHVATAIPPAPSSASTWLARLAILAAATAAIVVLAGGRSSLVGLAVALLGLGMLLAG